MSAASQGVLALSMLLAATGKAGPQSTVASARAAGDSAIARRDWQTLVAIYQPIVARDSANGMAWFRLGAGLQALHRNAASIAALGRAVSLRFQVGPADLRLAELFVRIGEPDSALAHLRRAADASLAVESITGDPDLTPLHNDRRYSALVEPLEAARYPCRGMAETHQLDFWVGDWAVTPWDGPSVSLGRQAENRISAELEHCIIHERWTSATGSKGESINFWDPNRKAWRQIWMDEGQWSLDYEGEYKDRAMRFHGWSLGADGTRRLEKLTFFNVAPDTVRQLFEQSADSGKTWTVTFDGRYVRLPARTPGR